MKGMLDRFTDNDLAVILIEEKNQEIIVPVKQLPEGSKENTWFDLKEVNGTIEIVSINDEKTKKEAQKSVDLLTQLRAKSKGSKFKKK